MKASKFSLSRIILFGRLIDELKLFYVAHFDFTVTEEVKGQWVILNAGSIELALHRIGLDYESEERKTWKVESNVKFVFQTDEDIRIICKQLIESGVIIGDIKSFEGISSLFCDGEDPEGNIFQIEQKKPEIF